MPDHTVPAPPPPQPEPSNRATSPEVHVHNVVRLDSSRAWNIAITLMVVAGLTAIGYQLSLGPLRDVVATGISMFLTTLISMMFRAGILRLPERRPEDDDLAFTKSTLRRVYDEVQLAIVKSSLVRLVLFAAGYTAGFLVLRAGVDFGLGLLTSLWMAVGVGLLVGAAIVAQDQIWAWIRTLHNKKGR